MMWTAIREALGSAAEALGIDVASLDVPPIDPSALTEAIPADLSTLGQTLTDASGSAETVVGTVGETVTSALDAVRTSEHE